MINFTLFKKKLVRLINNLFFFATIGKKKSTRPALQMDLTSRCNLRCKGCYYFSATPTPDLSDEELLKSLKEKASQGYKKLWIFNGEPTLRANIFPAIDKLFSEIHIISNGIIKITPQLDWKLWISLDGPKPVNDAIRGQGTFDQVVNNYKGDKRVGLVMTVNSANYKDIPDMVALVKKIGVKTISFTFYSRCVNDNNNDFDFKPEDLSAIEEILTKEMKKNGKYMLLDPATLKSLLYSQVNQSRWNNHCYFAEVLVDSYNAKGEKRRCCVENVICDTCRILPPHQFHCLMVTRKAPWWRYAFK